MNIVERVMAWFRTPPPDHIVNRHALQHDRLKQVEAEEEDAMKRVVIAGVKATLQADEARVSADKISGDLDRANSDPERVLRTAADALRFLERGHKK